MIEASGQLIYPRGEGAPRGASAAGAGFADASPIDAYGLCRTSASTLISLRLPLASMASTL